MYCGTDEAAVAAIATGNTTAPQYKGNVATETIVLANLDPLTEYFWRVDTKLVRKTMPPSTTYAKGEVWSFTTGPAGIGGILREWWTGITGTAVSNLTSNPAYPSNPSGSEVVNIFEYPPYPATTWADDYGTRLHGWLYVLNTGDYTFWIATDDNGELWLSTDMSPANATLISWVGDFAGGGWADPRQFDDPDVTPSGPIHLEADNMYYICGLMKEGGGGDNISVAWQGPASGGQREVIPGNHLIPYMPVMAEAPDPANRSVDAPLNTTLSWTAGIDQSTDSPYTTQHVYVGSDAAAVAAATTESPEYKGAPSGPNEYGPLSLSYYEHVYWRIDGVMADSGTVGYPGAVWTFKATYDPANIVDPHLKLWLMFDGDASDSSGHGRDGAEMNGPTYSLGYDEQAIFLDGVDDYIDLPIGADIASLTNSTFATWVNFNNMGGAWQRIFDFGSGTDTYLFLCPRIGVDGQMRFAIKPPGGVEQIVDTTAYLSSGWRHIAVTIDAAYVTANIYLDGEIVGTNPAVTLTPADVGEAAQNWLGRSQFAADGYFSGALDDFRIYDYVLNAAELAAVMRINLAWAWNPNPVNGAVDVDPDVTLSWNTGDGATGHSVYFGADDPANMLLMTPTPQSGTTYDPGTLALGTTYYWRIVESPGMDPGRTWKFSTANYIVIDNMDAYVPYDNAAGPHIFVAWRDGKGDCDGSGNDTGANLLETTPALFASSQLMQYDWDNDGYVFNPCTGTPDEFRPNNYSKIEAQVAGLPSGIGSNWTTGGVKALSLLFYGDTLNSINDPLWVQLSDSSGAGEKVEYGTYAGESLGDIQDPDWHEWLIDLNDFDVELTDVRSIAIGIGNEGQGPSTSSGTLYIDDVRLYTPRCIPPRSKFAADFDDNCKVDYSDLAVLFDSWLTGYIAETAWSGTWLSADIGDVSEAGSFSDLGGGAYSITGRGADIWDAADAFHYAYQPLSGDGQLTVRVTDIGGPSTNDWRKAGVMIRETLDADSPHAFMAICPVGGGGKAFQWRPTKGAASSSFHDIPPVVAAPMCVRIVRIGDTFRGFHYRDGKWIQQGDLVTIPMAENVYIGMAVTSHEADLSCITTFDRACSDEFIPTDLLDDKVINFLDYAELMDFWGMEQEWPSW